MESHSEILISVHNVGPSIPISDRERIFQRFYRSEGSKNMAAEPHWSFCRNKWPLRHIEPRVGH